MNGTPNFAGWQVTILAEDDTNTERLNRQLIVLGIVQRSRLFLLVHQYSCLIAEPCTRCAGLHYRSLSVSWAQASADALDGANPVPGEDWARVLL